MNLLYLCSVVLCSYTWAWSFTSPMVRSGADGDTHRRSLQSTVGTVTRLRLINGTARNRGEVLVDPFLNGAVINLFNYSANQMFSIEAIATNSTGPLGTVRFTFANRTNFRTEESAPFSLCGDSGGSFRNCSQLNVLGFYTLHATPFSDRPGTSVQGTPYSINFTVVNVPPAPVATPVITPTKTPTKLPSLSPAKGPTKVPTKTPTKTPTAVPVIAPVAPPVNLLTGQWIEVNKNATITPRHEACFVMVGNKAYLLSGRGIKAVDIYDPVTRTWTTGPAPPMEIHHTQCVAADNKIWIVSSWTGGYPRESNTASIYIYNTLNNTWSTKAGLPEARRRGGAASVLVGRRIYVSHGNRGGHETANFSTSLGWLDYYDIDSDVWVTNLPAAPNPRDHTGGALVNGRICVAGGRDGGSIGFFNETILPTDCYDPATNTWTVEANIPQGRAGSSYGRTCDGKLMVAGGEGYKKAWPNVDVFDGTSWTTIDRLNIARHGSGLAVDCRCNQIYIASGSRIQGGSVKTEIPSVETFFPGGVDVACPAP